MKKILKKLLYVLSTIFIICGMLLIIPVSLYADPPVVAVTSVDLNPETLTLYVGETSAPNDLKENVLPNNATDQSVTWSSNDTTIATVANGLVTGAGAGSAIITVTTNDGSFTDSCVVTVTAGTSGSIFLNGPNTFHANKSYTDFPKGECDVTLGPGQVLWHLVMTGIADGGTATIDGVSGVRHGKELQWTFINNLTISPDWEAVVTNGITDKIDLKVSHTCYGGVPEKGSITVCKTYSGEGDPPAEFNFELYSGTDTTQQPLQTFPVVPGGDCVTFGDLDFGTYTVKETDEDYNVVITGGDTSPVSGKSPISVQVTISENTPNVTVSFHNDPGTQPAFSVDVTKATSGSGFTAFDFILEKQDAKPENWTIVATLTGLSAGGPYEFVPSSPLDSGTYRVVETKRGGATNTAVDLVSMPTTASGDNNISAEFTWDGTSIATQNVYFLNDIPGKHKPPAFSVDVTKATSGSGFTTFEFTLQKDDGKGTFVDVPGAVLTGQIAGGPYAFVPSSPLVSGTYRVVETNRGGATNTEVSLTSMPTTASGDNSISGTFTWDGVSNATQDVYFLNDIPGKSTVVKVAVAGITEEEAVVEVLGITEELPYTGYNWLFSLAGLMLIALGGAILVIRFKPRKGMK